MTIIVHVTEADTMAPPGAVRADIDCTAIVEAGNSRLRYRRITIEDFYTHVASGSLGKHVADVDVVVVDFVNGFKTVARAPLMYRNMNALGRQRRVAAVVNGQWREFLTEEEAWLSEAEDARNEGATFLCRIPGVSADLANALLRRYGTVRVALRELREWDTIGMKAKDHESAKAFLEATYGTP